MLFNPEGLPDVIRRQKVLFLKIIEALEGTLDSAMPPLLTAIVGADYAEVKRLSHLLKGALASASVAELPALCAQMERLAELEQAAPLTALSGQVEQLVVQLRLELKSFH